ncbi:16S rRNA (cytidine(1402)-2'-O)-methyltransferase [Bacillus sp. FJAT-47783]|uniref:16S rRNA (cytidine(1402)-2'-O)-methyltransferase n=1 Tax=Bacillus sp. FJAT-47783 TaxID=2922712 RepID=UPI001FAD34B1|nr:16S rRNA (cytidine(1402)-2'-O)-methyltransferase [Bacillus sp. FJAT-47783]
MQQQKSFVSNEMTGTLYLVPTPIGNLEDMTFRAIRILKESDVIAAEDTRQTKKLCNHFDIQTPIISHHEHNKESSGVKIIQLLKEGQKVSLVSDAGMPTISDPGVELVKKVVDHGFPVIPLPGANAALTALIASGISTHPFYFFGFLDRQKKVKKKQLLHLRNRTETVILYESPHRLKETLQLMLDYLGNRSMAISRELTKKYEEFIRGTIEECLQWAGQNEIKGEFCLVVEGCDENEALAIEEEQAWWKNLTINEHVTQYIEKGFTSKEAIKQVSKDRNVPKREVYQAYHM